MGRTGCFAVMTYRSHNLFSCFNHPSHSALQCRSVLITPKSCCIYNLYTKTRGLYKRIAGFMSFVGHPLAQGLLSSSPCIASAGRNLDIHSRARNSEMYKAQGPPMSISQAYWRRPRTVTMRSPQFCEWLSELLVSTSNPHIIHLPTTCGSVIYLAFQKLTVPRADC
jgi:hypothetical protein